MIISGIGSGAIYVAAGGLLIIFGMGYYILNLQLDASKSKYSEFVTKTAAEGAVALKEKEKIDFFNAGIK